MYLLKNIPCLRALRVLFFLFVDDFTLTGRSLTVYYKW